MDSGLIAYCGVNCAECTDYKCHMCEGCKATEWEEGNTCMPVDCCRKRNIPFCAKCYEFPCEDMKAFYEESETHREAFKLMCEIKKKQLFQ